MSSLNAFYPMSSLALAYAFSYPYLRWVFSSLCLLIPWGFRISLDFVSLSHKAPSSSSVFLPHFRLLIVQIRKVLWCMFTYLFFRWHWSVSVVGMPVVIPALVVFTGFCWDLVSIFLFATCTESFWSGPLYPLCSQQWEWGWSLKKSRVGGRKREGTWP